MRTFLNKILFTTLIFAFSAFCFTYTRTIDVDHEIKSASYHGEVIFKSYDTIKVSQYSKYYHRVLKDPKTGKEYSDTNYVDSVWVLDRLHFIATDSINTKLSVNVYKMYSWITYRARPAILPGKFPSHGFWPKINDTCLLVVDQKGAVSILGLLKDNKYIFWDPYPNSSCNSYFIFDSPFNYYPKPPSAAELKRTKHLAEWDKKQFVGQYHCCISKKDFLALYKR